MLFPATNPGEGSPRDDLALRHDADGSRDAEERGKSTQELVLRAEADLARNLRIVQFSATVENHRVLVGSSSTRRAGPKPIRIWVIDELQFLSAARLLLRGEISEHIAEAERALLMEYVRRSAEALLTNTEPPPELPQFEQYCAEVMEHYAPLLSQDLWHRVIELGSCFPSAKAVLSLVDGVEYSAETTAVEIFSLYQKACTTNRLTWHEILRPVHAEAERLLRVYCEMVEDGRRRGVPDAALEEHLKAYVAAQRQSMEMNTWPVQMVLHLLTRQERAHLDLESLKVGYVCGPLCPEEAEKIMVLTGKNDALVTLCQAMEQAIDAAPAYGEGAAERFRRELAHPDLRVHATFRGGKLAAFFTRLATPYGEHLDWWTMAEPSSGLGNATLLFPLRDDDGNCSFDVNWQSAPSCIEELCGIGYEVTDDGLYPRPYIGGWTLNAEEITRCPAKQAKHAAAVSAAQRTAESQPESPQHFSLDGATHVSQTVSLSIRQKMRERRQSGYMGVELFRLMQCFQRQGLVLVRCIRSEQDDARTCVFGPDPRSEKRRKLQEQSVEWRRTMLKNLHRAPAEESSR